MDQVALIFISLITGYSPLPGVLWSFPIVPGSVLHMSHHTIQLAMLKLKHVSCFELPFHPLPHSPCGECSLLDLTQENRNAHAEISTAMASSGYLWGEDGLLLSCLFSLPHRTQGYVTPNALQIFSGTIQSNMILTNLHCMVSELGPKGGVEWVTIMQFSLSGLEIFNTLASVIKQKLSCITSKVSWVGTMSWQKKKRWDSYRTYDISQPQRPCETKMVGRWLAYLPVRANSMCKGLLIWGGTIFGVWAVTKI